MDARISTDKKTESFGFRSDSAPGGPGAITQISALALALLLGFGMGVTFQSSRENQALARGAASSSSESEVRILQAPKPSAAKASEAAPSVADKASMLAEPPLAAVNASTAQQAVPAKAGEIAPSVTEAKASPQAEPPSSNVSPTATSGLQPVPPQPSLAPYAYVYRFQKDGAFGFKTGSGKFENLLAVRAAAITECKSKGGQNCKFNFAPAGGCIAVAHPPFGEFRVSTVKPDEASASADAMDQCLNEHDGGCRVVKVLCPQS